MAEPLQRFSPRKIRKEEAEEEEERERQRERAALSRGGALRLERGRERERGIESERKTKRARTNVRKTKRARTNVEKTWNQKGGSKRGSLVLVQVETHPRFEFVAAIKGRKGWGAQGLAGQPETKRLQRSGI